MTTKSRKRKKDKTKGTPVPPRRLQGDEAVERIDNLNRILQTPKPDSK